MTTYPFGYSTPPKQLALEDLEKRSNWSNLHPEFRRRLIAMFDDARLLDKVLGLGGGWRSTQSQETLFLARHERTIIGGCCSYQGKRYRLRKGMAHAAPPGRSYHESVAELGGFAVAADLIGDLPWMNSVAAKYGLIHFAAPNPLREAWHVQPVELPPARGKYEGQQLTVFQLPDRRRTLKRGDTGDDVKMAQQIMATKAGQVIAIDGKFGAQTEAAVVNVQKFFQLSITREIDSPTWAVLDFLNTL